MLTDGSVGAAFLRANRRIAEYEQKHNVAIRWGRSVLPVLRAARVPQECIVFATQEIKEEAEEEEEECEFVTATINAAGKVQFVLPVTRQVVKWKHLRKAFRGGKARWRHVEGQPVFFGDFMVDEEREYDVGKEDDGSDDASSKEAKESTRKSLCRIVAGSPVFFGDYLVDTHVAYDVGEEEDGSDTASSDGEGSPSPGTLHPLSPSSH